MFIQTPFMDKLALTNWTLDPVSTVNRIYVVLHVPRLCKLLISGGTKVLRDIFDGIHPPRVLRNHLDDPAIKTILRKLRSKRVLFQEQWDKLYGPSSSSVTSANFDITLLCLLLQHICGLPNPAKGWKDEPSPANLNTEDDIVRVRIFRNRLYGHISEPALSDVEFKKQWNNIETVLIRLGADKAAIDTLKRQSLEQEAERHFIQCLEEWENNEKTVLAKLEEFRAENNEKHQETQEKLNEILTRTASPSPTIRIGIGNSLKVYSGPKVVCNLIGDLWRFQDPRSWPS